MVGPKKAPLFPCLMDSPMHTKWQEKYHHFPLQDETPKRGKTTLLL
jgi:hypothetical protein